MAYFKRMTTAGDRRNAVIMGRKTWESIPERFRPLPNRLNIVISRSADALRANMPDGVLIVSGFEAALTAADETDDVGEIFVIGGATIYTLALMSPRCQTVYLTRVKHPFECDTFMPPVDPEVFAKVQDYDEEVTEGEIRYVYEKHERI